MKKFLESIAVILVFVGGFIFGCYFLSVLHIGSTGTSDAIIGGISVGIYSAVIIITHNYTRDPTFSLIFGIGSSYPLFYISAHLGIGLGIARLFVWAISMVFFGILLRVILTRMGYQPIKQPTPA